MRIKHVVNIGDRYGRLTVDSIAHHPSRSIYFECSCDCGGSKVVRKDALYTQVTQSCGCLMREATKKRMTTHGLAGVGRPPEYDCWAHMLSRCYNPNHSSWKDYGERGIQVCDRWKNSFENFYVDMGERPTNKHSLDRINNNGDYEPSNCRWATSTEQANNTRRNRQITFRGKTLNQSQWEKELGLGRNIVQYRLRNGWTVEEALTIKSGRRLSPVMLGV